MDYFREKSVKLAIKRGIEERHWRVGLK